MSAQRPSFLVLALLAATLGVPGTASASGPRQYYGSWHKHQQHSYSYRPLYYKPTPTYSGYKHHYAVYHPSRPKHVYFYNPYKKTYWGRCELSREGRNEYSLLAEKDRKGALEEIPEAAFPAPAPAPALPETTDGATLDLPPDDLPPGVETAIALPGDAR